MMKQSVALEVLSYHATASKEEAERIIVSTTQDQKDYWIIQAQVSSLSKAMSLDPRLINLSWASERSYEYVYQNETVRLREQLF